MDLNKEENNIENFHYVYFIESHDISLNVKISLSEKYSESNTLELIELAKKKDSASTCSVNIYRFKIIPSKIRVLKPFLSWLQCDKIRDIIEI